MATGAGTTAAATEEGHARLAAGTADRDRAPARPSAATETIVAPTIGAGAMATATGTAATTDTDATTTVIDVISAVNRTHKSVAVTVTAAAAPLATRPSALRPNMTNKPLKMRMCAPTPTQINKQLNSSSKPRNE